MAHCGMFDYGKYYEEQAKQGIEYCEHCMQMTNHKDGKCLKCGAKDILIIKLKSGAGDE